jgi:hypothetical protein
LAVALCHLQAEQARVRFGLPEALSVTKPRGVRVGLNPARSRVTQPYATRIESAQ